MYRAVQQSAEELRRTAEEAAREGTEGDIQALRAHSEVQRELRRQSVAGRLAEGRRHCALDAAQHRAQLEALLAEMALHREEWLDRRARAAQEQEQRRESVGQRLEQWRVERVLAEKELMQRSLGQEEEALIARLDREAVAEAQQAADEHKRLQYVMTKFNI
jgi:hypothetical protein